MLFTSSRNQNDDFIEMGRGIVERRAKALSRWQRHEELSKSFIRNALNGEEKKEISIIGAGNLFDIDCSDINEKASSVHLYDADPCVSKGWRKIFPHYIPHIGEVTGTIDRWTTLVSKSRSVEELEEVLYSLDTPKVLPLKGDTVISLNSYGQIPLYWHYRILKKLSSILKTIEISLSTTLAEALVASHNKLLQGHANQLFADQPDKVIVVTDTYRATYTPDISTWQPVPYIPTGEEYLFEHKQYQCVTHDSWLWHVAPCWLEPDGEGSIHEIGAFLFEKR